MGILVGVGSLMVAYSIFWLRRRGVSKRLQVVPGAICLSYIGQQILWRVLDGVSSARWFLVLSWITSIAFGVWGLSLGLAFLQDLSVRLGKFLWSKKEAGQQNPQQVLETHDPKTRRQMLLSIFQWAPLSGSVLVNGLGIFEAYAGPRVKTVVLNDVTGGKKLTSLRCVQISDLHVGTTIRRAYVQNVVQRVLDLQPDIIFVTGDLADGLPAVLQEFCAPLADLKAKLGVYFITGNHEYYWDVHQWIDQVKQFGWKILLNDSVVIDFQGVKILISGVTDSLAYQFVADHKMNFEKARGTSIADYKIVLSHRPNFYQEAQAQGFDLMLSGHTHGGQFFPVSVLVHMIYKFAAGLGQFKNMQVYVNSGTGYWGPINRFAVPSEITLFEFKTPI
jgi:predicted MPP superfamily phosphohydrolase